jgi:hypothetical protein
MIKYIKIISIFSLIYSYDLIQAQTFQNLVPNGSFETFTQCPVGPISFAPPWTGPTTNSTDYFNACSLNANVPYYGGINSFYPYYLNAKSGKAYAGMHVYNSQNYREYAQVELIDTLKNGSCYFVEFHCALCQNCVLGINNIAANMSYTNYPNNLPNPGVLINIPNHISDYNNSILKDTVKWVKISGIYKASGVEKFMIIGNFKSDSNTDTIRIYKLGTGPIGFANFSYIFIDAVSVFSINPNGNLPWSYRDTTIIKGDSVYIGNKMGGLNFHPKWYDMNGNYLATNAGITVRPINTSSYVIQYTICGVQRADTIEVKVLPDVGFSELSQMQAELNLYPIPATNELHLTYENNGLFKSFDKIEIINHFGQSMLKEAIYFKDKKVKIKTDQLPDGIYLLRLLSGEALSISKQFFISR